MQSDRNTLIMPLSGLNETREKEKPDTLKQEVTLDEDMYLFILWNDDINDMFDVVVSLYEVCGLLESQCVKVMLVAHQFGSSVVKPGTLSELRKLDDGMRARKLTTSIELLQPMSNLVTPSN